MNDGVLIDVELDGSDENILRMLQGIDTAFSTEGIMGWLTGEVGPYLRERTEARFKGEGDDVVGQWAPLGEMSQLARSYMAEQYGIAPDHPINHRTGDLEEYMTSGVGVTTGLTNGAQLTFPGGKPMGELRSKITTAQIGKNYPPTVARPVLGVNEKDMLWVSVSLAFHLADNVREVMG